MKAYHYKDIENQDVPEPAEKVKIRWLINEKQGAPNFAMRRFEVEPGGSTPYHTHPWEHEVYVLEGDAVAVSKKGENEIGPGSVILVEPKEEHNFVNTGNKPLVFLCMIPLQK
ncbi:cupin domain-containing protein [Candidatus Bathyarchaeota archaeon]|jgi:quercetin dioxygenase-like cupin family protein|nr:cupin domain-containing protein [Candidatus Bathyarchaeota archaeon]TFH14758.1 MAG: cupin domain-containing protein [Candidatus Bathyarchaeota archaeon]